MIYDVNTFVFNNVLCFFKCFGNSQTVVYIKYVSKFMKCILKSHIGKQATFKMEEIRYFADSLFLTG